MRLLAIAAAFAVAGCGTLSRTESPPSPAPAAPAAPAPAKGAYYKDDGPGANAPANLAAIPDAVPRAEPLNRFANRPYQVLGRDYAPMTRPAPFRQSGIGSWYGRRYHGAKTSSGEVYDMYAMTAAHPTLPIPSYARVRNPANGREVVLRINDRGPFHAGRIVDLSYTAALKLDLLRGVGPVELQRITFDDIRTGTWRRDGEPVRLAEENAPVVAQAPAPLLAPAAVEPEVAVTPPAVTLPAAAYTPPADAAPVADAPAARAFTKPARGFWVQLGAFKQRDGAEVFHKRVSTEADWLAPLLAVFSDASVFRLQAGPYPSRDEARGVAERVRLALQLVPVIVERR